MARKKAKMGSFNICLVPKTIYYKLCKDLQLLKVERLIKIIYYDRIKVTIDAPDLVEVIINIVLQ